MELYGSTCDKLNVFAPPHMIRFARHSSVALLLAAPTLFSGAAAPVRHPLDALTSQEYWAVFETMKASGKLDAASRYAGINLHEPPKAEVLQWKPGDPFRREALAVVKQGRRTFEAIVDVANRKLVSWKEIKGVEPVLIADESEGVGERLKAGSPVASRHAQARHHRFRHCGLRRQFARLLRHPRRAGPPAAASDLFRGPGFLERRRTSHRGSDRGVGFRRTENDPDDRHGRSAGASRRNGVRYGHHSVARGSRPDLRSNSRFAVSASRATR